MTFVTSSDAAFGAACGSIVLTVVRKEVCLVGVAMGGAIIG